MQSRRLVSCGLIDAGTMKVTASDGTDWLHRVERNEQGDPIPGQIGRWLNLIWAPARNGHRVERRWHQQGTVRSPGKPGLTAEAAGPTNASVRGDRPVAFNLTSAKI